MSILTSLQVQISRPFNTFVHDLITSDRSVVHDAAVINNVLDQLNDVHDETKAQRDCPGDGQGGRCSPQQRSGPAQRGG